MYMDHILREIPLQEGELLFNTYRVGQLKRYWNTKLASIFDGLQKLVVAVLKINSDISVTATENSTN